MPTELATTGSSAPRIFRFGAFEFDPRKGELRKHGVRIKLQGQPIAVLAMLLEHAAEVVTREELQKRLWTADTYVDFEHSLNAAIKRLRTALGDTADAPRFVETLARRGYRFIAPLSQLVVEDPSQSVPQPAAPIQKPVRRYRYLLASVAARISNHPWLIAGPAALVIVAALTVWVFRSGLARSTNLSSIAVLPFTDLSPQQDQEYLCDGITEELIHALANVPGLRVPARTSVYRFKGKAHDLTEIGTKLRVSAVLEGSVQRLGDRLRIWAQLVKVADGYHMLSESWDRDAKDLLSLQEEITRLLVASLRLKLDGRSLRRHTSDQEAYKLYLQGRFYLNRLQRPDADRAAQLYGQAIRKDPTYALAYAGLADVYNYRSHGEPELTSKAAAAARKALELDPNLAEAHVSLGANKAWDWEWKSAEAHFRRALELDPNCAMGRQWYALFYLIPMGRIAEAVAESEKVLELEPFSAFLQREAGWVFYLARQYDRAIKHHRMALQLDPAMNVKHQLMADYLAKGQAQEAIQVGEGHEDKRAIFHAFLALAHAISGGRSEAALRISNVEADANRGDAAVGPSYFYAFLGDTEQAFRWLEKAVTLRAKTLPVRLRADPMYDKLRSDPRFSALMRKMGLN
jgi:TolB-like protein/DNA-binding winged helix-turn-helix (wHTH) protein